MARILITGGAGYVGSHCAKAAAAAGHECIVFDSLASGHRDFVRWGPLIEGDIRDAAALDAVFSTQSIAAVMHFAALAYVGESVTDPGRYYDVNIGGTRILLDAMVRAGVPAIVFSSTCAVYGEPDVVPITEGVRLDPISPYGHTKLVCERMMDDFGRAYGMTSVRLRYFNAAGADPDGEIGEDHDPETHLIPLVLDVAAGWRKAISVFGTDYPTPDGTAIRDYIHVTDLADAHVRALAYLLRGGASTSVNLGTRRGVSVAQLIEAARRVTGLDIPVRSAPRRPGDPAQLIADPSRAEDVLGWAARGLELEPLLGDAWHWHRLRNRQNYLSTDKQSS